jgi:hypothetical protein
LKYILKERISMVEKKEQPVVPAEQPKKRFALPTNALPEAGGVAMVDMYGGYSPKDENGNPLGRREFKVMLSARGRTAQEALENVVDAITQGKLSVEEFMAMTNLSIVGHVGNQAPAPRASAPTSAHAPAPVGTVSAPVPVSAPAPVNAQVPSAPAVTGGAFEVTYVEFLPQPSGKVKVSFFGNDKKQPHNQYPFINWVTDPSFVPAKFASVAQFTPDMFKSALAYDLPCRLFWVPGSLNSQGQPYKNIDRIEPA